MHGNPFQWVPGESYGQGSLAGYGPWVTKSQTRLKQPSTYAPKYRWENDKIKCDKLLQLRNRIKWYVKILFPILMLFFFLTEFIFWISFRFTAKLGRKYREFPYTSCHTGGRTFNINVTHQRGEFFTMMNLYRHIGIIQSPDFMLNLLYVTFDFGVVFHEFWPMHDMYLTWLSD